MKITPDLISRLVREEVQAIYREEEEEHQDEKGSDDEVQRADDQGMKKNVEVAAKFMFKHPQLSKALGKMVGDKVESAQLLSLLAQELGIEPNEISSIMSKVKKSVNKGADQEEEAAADAKKAGGDEGDLEEGRYHRTPYQGDDPRAQAFDQAITILDDQVFDSLEGDVAAYADEAVRALSKAIEELEYQRNQVGNISEKRK